MFSGLRIENLTCLAIEGLGGIFQGKEAKSVGEKVIDERYRQIGQLKEINNS